MKRTKTPLRNRDGGAATGRGIDAHQARCPVGRVEGATMSNIIRLSRRLALVWRLAFQDGIWGTFMTAIQRSSESMQNCLRFAGTQKTAILFRLFAVLLFLFGILFPVHAQHQFAYDLPQDVDYTIPARPNTIPDYSGSLNTQPSQGIGGFGVIGRAGHEAGDTIGRSGSLTFFDVSPYSFLGNNIVFGDGRLFIHNNGKMGGSAGLGIRHFFPSRNSILGSTFYYDHDESRGVTFEQFTVASELLTEFFDVRANVHIPFGNKRQVTAVRFEPGTQQFVDALNMGVVQGSNIQFQSRSFSSAALEGVDVMMSAPIQGDLAETINLEVSAGGYHYQARGLDLEKITGWKVRLDGDILDRLSHLSLEVSNDNVFDTNVVFSADINYWHHLDHQQRLRKSQYGRLASWVRRARTVSTFDSSALNAPELAINPLDNQPYLIYHVRNNPTPPPNNFPAPLGNGSESMPFQYIQEGIDAAPFADIIFVHANSQFDGIIDGNANAQAVLRENVLVLGEGVPLTIPVVGSVTEIDLPTVTPLPASRPVIQNVTGPVITLADNSRFAGFTIQNYMDGPAILADGVNNGAEVNELIIDTSTGALGTGITISNSAGQFVFENVAISNTSGDAFQVFGGNANIVFNGENLIDNSSEFAVLIEDAAGSVNMRNTMINDDGGRGILIQGTAPGMSTANVTIDQASLINTASGSGEGAFQVLTHSGAVTVLNDLAITTPNAGGILIDDLQPSGSVVFQAPTTITNRNEFGILLRDFVEGPSPLNPMTNRAGTVNFLDTVSITGLGGTPNTDAAIDMNTSSGAVIFQDIDINTSLGPGIDISNLADTGTTTGRFVVNGMTSITNTLLDDAINIENVAKANFQTIFSDVDIDNRGLFGIDVSANASTTRFVGTVNIDNQFLTNAPAIFVTDNTGDVGFTIVNVNNAIGLTGFDAGVIVFNNTDPDPNNVANVSFGSLNVEYLGAAALGDTAVFIDSNENVEIGSGIIDATLGRGVTVTLNNFHDIAFESISASNDDYGIYVSASIGQFAVTGVSQVGGTGGTILGMSADGAHFDNTQAVDLGYIDFVSNRVGVHAFAMLVEGQGTVVTQAPPTGIDGGSIVPAGTELEIEGGGVSPILILRGLDISNSPGEGVQIGDVSDIMVLDSTISDTGLVVDEQVEIVAAISSINIDGDDGDTEEDVVYNIDFINNNIVDSSPQALDMIFIHTSGLIGGDTMLNLNFLNHGTPGSTATIGSISSDRPGDSALHVNWSGPANINIDNNTFILSDATSQTAVELEIDGVSNVAFTNNYVLATGIFATGIDFEFGNSTNLTISDNAVLDDDGFFTPGSGFQMAGIGSTGMSLTFAEGGNNIFIENNLLNLFGDDGTGIEFQRISAPSQVAINGNSIFLTTDFLAPREEGIIFRNVRGVINLSGSVDNQVPIGTLLPFFIDFFIPAGTSNGQIIVNGSPRP